VGAALTKEQKEEVSPKRKKVQWRKAGADALKAANVKAV
jgi:hypothetical protein